MINAFLAMQVSTIDLSTNPQNNIVIQAGGIGLLCPNGVLMQDLTLAASSSNITLAFPNIVTTALFICITAITTTDLIVKVGSGSPVSLSIPSHQSVMLYNLTSSQVSLSSAAGGQVQYAIGG